MDMFRSWEDDECGSIITFPLGGLQRKSPYARAARVIILARTG